MRCIKVRQAWEDVCDVYNSHRNQPKNKGKSGTELDRNSYILFIVTNGIGRKSTLHLKHIN